MRNLTSALLFPVVAALTLTGCYAEIEDQSVSIQRLCDGSSTCTFRGIPTALQELLPISLASGSTEFTVDLGGQDVLQPSKEFGPFKLNSTLTVNSVVLQARNGVSLDGIQTLRILQLEPGCTATGCQGTLIASYDRPPEGSADPTRLVLQGNRDVNLLQFGSTLSVRLEAAGRLPDTDWQADLTVDGHLKARADMK